MSKRKITALFVLSSGCLFALGWNCLPNIGFTLASLLGTTT